MYWMFGFQKYIWTGYFHSGYLCGTCINSTSVGLLRMNCRDCTASVDFFIVLPLLGWCNCNWETSHFYSHKLDYFIPLISSFGRCCCDVGDPDCIRKIPDILSFCVEALFVLHSGQIKTIIMFLHALCYRNVYYHALVILNTVNL